MAEDLRKEQSEGYEVLALALEDAVAMLRDPFKAPEQVMEALAVCQSPLYMTFVRHAALIECERRDAEREEHFDDEVRERVDQALDNNA